MSEYDDSHMLSKILERMAAQSLHLKDKIDSGLEIPSWAEYKLYNAYSGLGSALGTAYPGTYGEDKMAAFSGALDRHPALKGKQSELPDKIQAGIIKKKLRMRKQAASTESQLLQALSAEGGAAGMKALRKRVKEDDLEKALKALIASGKVRRHPDGDLIKESAAFNDIFDTGRKKNQEFLSHNKGLTSQQKRKYRRETLKTMKALPTVKLESGRSMPDYRQWSVHPPSHYGIGKEAAATATKTDPAKWEAAKREAKAKMGGKHSARAMQVATNIYKKNGGGYSGAKPTSKNNSLKKWGKQKWQWSGGDKPGQGGKGVYLPKKKQDRLRDSEKGRKLLARAARKKSEATRKGQQYSSHGLAANTSLKTKRGK